MVIFAVDDAGWELMLYLFDDVYVDASIGGSKVLLDLLLDEGVEGRVVHGR